MEQIAIIHFTNYPKGQSRACMGAVMRYTQQEKKTLWEFHDRLYFDYRELFFGDRNVLFKMKEVWSYLAGAFESSEKYAKKIKKAGHSMEYEAAVDALFRECKLR